MKWEWIVWSRLEWIKKHFCPEVEYVKQDIMLPADQGLDLRNVKDVFGRMIFHLQDSPSLLNISGQDFVLPENCSFLLSDASNLNPLVVYAKQNGLYDFCGAGSSLVQQISQTKL